MAMGTIIRLTLISSQKVANKASEKALANISKLEKDFDHRIPYGSTGKININAGICPVSVSNECFSLIKRAIKFCEISKGVFDITIGTYSTVDNYYTKDFDNTNKNKINYRLIQINETEKTVFLPEKGMAIDLGGLAKGTIIDNAAMILKSSGIKKGIVEAGGDFYCFGNKEWKIGIMHPRSNNIIGCIYVKEKGVCGSGDYYQYEIEDKSKNLRKHHIINPFNMKSANKSIGVTVISESAEIADALATTLFIMGYKKGKNFLQKNYPESSALWVLPDLSIIKTDNFPDFIKD